MTVPSLLILGTDAVLAAAPATPVQLAHACLAAGYRTVIPSSWGDELIASRVIARLRESEGPVLLCSCPLVARRVAMHGDSLTPFLLSLVSPPVATAQYLRAAYAPIRPQITFAGDCSSGGHPTIDRWLTARELGTLLAERGIEVTAQPTEFDAILPPDRRRYFSEPGGVPSRSTLRHLPSPVELVELKGDDIVAELAQQLLSGTRTLVDIATSMGCSCSGAFGEASVEAARARVREQEPPRALAPVVDHSVSIALESLVAAPPRPPVPALEVRQSPEPLRDGDATAPDPTIAVDVMTRLRTPAGQIRAVLGGIPHANVDEGRRLPRAYVARRRSAPRGMRRFSGEQHVADFRRRRALWILGGSIGVAMGLGVSWLMRVLQ